MGGEFTFWIRLFFLLSVDAAIGVSLTFMTAGVNPASMVMWTLLHCADQPDNVQKRIHKEIDEVIGNERTPVWADRNKMPFTMASIWESHRYAPINPVGLPRGWVSKLKLLAVFLRWNVHQSVASLNLKLVGTVRFPSLTELWSVGAAKDPHEHFITGPQRMSPLMATWFQKEPLWCLIFGLHIETLNTGRIPISLIRPGFSRMTAAAFYRSPISSFPFQLVGQFFVKSNEGLSWTRRHPTFCTGFRYLWKL